jgi:hypothetical protein
LRIDDEFDQLDELERDINSGWDDTNLFSGVGSGKKQFSLGPLPNVNIPRLNTSICNSIENLDQRNRVKRAMRKHTINIK